MKVSLESSNEKLRAPLIREGSRILFRKFKQSDINREYRGWFNDFHAIQFLRMNGTVQTQKND